MRSAQVTTGNDAQASAAPQTLPDKVIIIFAGTDQDAELLKFIQNDTNATASDLTAIVRSGEDSGAAAVTTSGVTLQLLTSKFGVPIPAIVLPQQAKP